ncbi:MAG: nucleotidyltransferase domain-containing protein [Ignavibacteria bacterium]|nr:nucleotidyltransferase domain-containing protein [Ignavibacteria bacterium]
MRFGLSENIISEINGVFEEYPKVEEVIIFGSRSAGNFKPGSDIDLAVKGKDITLSDILKISVQMENIISPFRADLINYNSVTDPDVMERINKGGKVFYERKLAAEKNIRV